MELLKPFYRAIALLGLDTTKPFHALLVDPSITYSTLNASFKRLYQDLTKILAKNFQNTDQVSSFVTKDIYENSRLDECLQFLEEPVRSFSPEFEKLVTVALPKFANGFETQIGAIFRLGLSADPDPSSVLKVYNTDKGTLEKFDMHVQFHNLAQD